MATEVEKRQAMKVALISELIESLESVPTNSNGKSILPSPIQFFRLGLVLHDLQQREAHDDGRAIQQHYSELLERMPSQYLTQVVFRELNASFSAIAAASNIPDNDLKVAIESISGLYNSSSLACQLGWSLDLCSSLASIYDQIQQQNNSQHVALSDEKVLIILSSLVMDGLLVICEGDDEENQLRRLLEVVKILTTDTKSNVLGNLLAWQEQAESSQTLIRVVQSRFEESPQREYLLMMLQVSRDEVDQVNVQAASTMERASSQQLVTPITSPKDPAVEIRRRVQQVRDVLSDLGEGYIETVLSYFQGDVQRTIAALLEGDASELPPALRMIDQKLPARRRETPKRLEEADDEARRIVKERLAEQDRKEEAEAVAFNTVLGEYDDDYDDQYDGMDGGEALGNADSGLYDYDMIRTYNKVALQIEREDAFWEQNRNLNRKADNSKKQEGTNDTNSLDQEEGNPQCRGLDKGKGGRIIGPDGKFLPRQKGGKKGQPQNPPAVVPPEAAKAETVKSTLDANNAMSNNQRRYKNNNKAKIGNHNRKDRAARKAGA